MRSTTQAAVTRLAGALTGILLLATLLAAPNATAAANSKPVAARSEAGLLAPGAGYDQPQGSTRVHALQIRLRAAGEIPGPVDGRFGPITEAAVRHFQAREVLAVDGVVGPHTQTALRRAAALVRRGMGYANARGSGRVRKLQRELRAAGEHPGPIDGRFGPLTERAVRDLQDQGGLAVDGIVGKATQTALARRLTSVRTPGSGRHSGQAGKGKPEPGGISGQPKASRPVGQPREAPVGNQLSDDSGLGTTTAIALVLAAALALLSAILGLALRRRRRSGGPQYGHPPVAGSEATEPGWAGGHLAATKGRSTEAVRVLGYASIDASPGSSSNGEFQAQAEKIVAECDRRGLALLELVREREPHHGAGGERPGLGYALERISAGDAQGLMVADLSRLGRSVPELGRILEWFSNSGARLVVIAQGLDTREPEGRVMARTLIEVSGWERERLIERTRQGMRAARRKGPPAVADNPELKLRISRMRDQGMTLQAISDRLNAEGVPTVRGGAEWRPSSVQAAAGYRRPRARDRLGASWNRNGETGNGGF